MILEGEAGPPICGVTVSAWVCFIGDGKEGELRFIRKVSFDGGEATVVATAPDGWSVPESM